MNISAFLKKRSLWQHGAPASGEDRAYFDASIKDGDTLEVPSFFSGVYVSNKMVGKDPQPISLRATGYFLAEHILGHEKWKGSQMGDTTTSRLDDLLIWGSEDKHLKQLSMGSEPYNLSPNKPSQFEWLLWQTRALSMDINDPSLSLDRKKAELGLLKEEVARVSKVWSQRKSTTKSGGENVLTRADVKAKNSIKKYLDSVFSYMSVPASEKFYLNYNPDALAKSVTAGVAFDETYQKPSDIYVDSNPDRDPFFDEEEPEEQEPSAPVLTDSRKEMVQKCLTSFFLFENGNAIISTIRSAKSQPGLRTVEPGVVLDIPESLLARLPAKLAYLRSVAGVPDPETGKTEKAYKYATVGPDGVPLVGLENEISVDAATHKQIRLETSPWLKMPDVAGVPSEARYIESRRFGKHPNVKHEYTYISRDKQTFILNADDHKKVFQLNPEHVSANTRGKIDHLFTNFFVDGVKPHYRPYLPESRDERLFLAEKVKASLQPFTDKAWNDINENGGSALDNRTELAKTHYGEWLKHFLSPEMKALAPKLFEDMKSQHGDQVRDIISKRAREAAVVGYMEDVKGGENPAPNYGSYGLRGKYKTWKTQVLNEGGQKLLDERIAQATNWAEEKFGGLDALVPESHSTEKLLSHFATEAGAELRGVLENRGIPQTKGLVSLTDFVNPMSVVVFYDRRMQHLDWNFNFDVPLPEMNLSKLAKEGKGEVKADPAGYWADVDAQSLQKRTPDI